MFKIYDGRSHFYQWDIDRKLIVEDASISEVHFCNQTDNYSLVCKTYIEDGLNLVNVPNILLQNDWRINVYAYDSNYTKFSEQFDVIRRCKPEDYVYTETEILNYNTLSDRITKIEEGGGITPTIGDNGNWYLGNTDTNKPSRGKSAYSYAQDGGYTGTEAEFAAKLAAEGLDKALYVVNITSNSDGTPSTDKTFEEIINVYNEGKYNIVAAMWGSYVLIIPLLTIEESSVAVFSVTFDDDVIRITITPENKVLMQVTPLATTTSKLPNPHPLTFTGAVSETYDGSSAKTIEIPSGGGATWHEIGKQEFDGIESAVEFTCNGEAFLVLTIDHTEGLSSVIVTLEHIDGVKNNMYKHAPNRSAFTPKMSFLIFGGTKDRGMISIKGESQEYNGGISNATIEQGFNTTQSPDGAIERVSQSALVKITVTFDAAPKSGAAISLEGI